MLLDKRKHWITLALALAVIGIWTILLRDVRDLFLEKETSEEAQRDGSLSPENWPMFRGTPSLQGYVDAELPRKLFLEWVFKTKGAIRSSAAVVNNKVLFGSDDGCVYALKANTGELAWMTQTGDGIESSPCVLGDSLYIGSNDGLIHSFRVEDGTALWKFQTEDRILGGVNWFADSITGRNRIVFGGYDTKLYCLDGETGQLLWSHETGNYINGTPAVGDNTVVFGGCDALVHVVSVRDGTSLAQIDVGSYVPGSVALARAQSDADSDGNPSDDFQAFVGHYGNEVLCVALDSQEIVWRYQGTAAFFSSPAVTESRVIIGSRDRKLHCIERRTGIGLWTFVTQGNVDCSPLVVGDKVLFGSDDGRLYLVSVSDGTLLWSYDIGKAITACPAVAAGRIFIGSEDGGIYAFGTTSRKESSR